MNTKIILALTTAALLATSTLAYNGQGQMKQSCNGYKQGYGKHKMMQRKNHRGSFSFVHMVMKLDLSDKQRDEIRAIVKKSMKNIPNPNEAFSETEFDKQKFINLHKEKRESKFERKADMIEDIYGVLNASQKKDLKTMLDMKRVMKKNKMYKNKGANCNYKNCQNK